MRPISENTNYIYYKFSYLNKINYFTLNRTNFSFKRKRYTIIFFHFIKNLFQIYNKNLRNCFYCDRFFFKGFIF